MRKRRNREAKKYNNYVCVCVCVYVNVHIEYRDMQRQYIAEDSLHFSTEMKTSISESSLSCAFSLVFLSDEMHDPRCILKKII